MKERKMMTKMNRIIETSSHAAAHSISAATC